jgi:hypothetical protein
MFIFLKFLLAHILGDFVFQSKKWVNDKEKNKVKSLKLYFHIGIHVLLLLLILQLNLQEYWLGFILIIISHYAIDLIKLYFQKKKTKRIWFFVDQVLHIIVLVIASSFYMDFNFDVVTDALLEKITLLIVCVVLVTSVSSIVINNIISKWTPEQNKESQKEQKKVNSLKNAGHFIGILERLLVFIFIITEHWEAIGFLLAAKSVFRFGDLKSSNELKLTEYILIGTLLSFGLAIVIGIVYTYLIEII